MRTRYRPCNSKHGSSPKLHKAHDFDDTDTCSWCGLTCAECRITFADDVAAEIEKARGKHAAIHSLHEGWAVIREELDELWEHVRRKETDHSGNAGAYKELVQLGAMAQRVAEDVVAPNSVLDR